MPDDDLDLVEQLITKLADLEAMVGTLQERVAAVEADLEGGEDAEPDGLDEWVEWLIPTYELQVVLDGWESEPGIVRELAALMKAHIAIVGKRKGFDDVTWHSHLASMITRVVALRSRKNEARQKAATRGGSLAGIIGKGHHPSDAIPAESR